MTSTDTMVILDLIHKSTRDLLDKEVQVGFLSNGQAVTIELSAFRRKLITLSIIIFSEDKDKVQFLWDVLTEISKASDAYDVISSAIIKYDKQFKF